MTDALRSAQLSIQNSKALLIDKLLLALTCVAVIGAPISASRASVTGWLALYTLHILLASLVLSTWLFRKHLNSNTKALIICAIMTVVGVAGVLKYGLLAAGIWWLASTVFVAGVCISRRVGIIAGLGFLTIMCLFAAAYTRGYLSVDINLVTYMSSISAWANIIVIATVLPVVLFTIFSRYNALIIELAEGLSAAQDELEKAATIDTLTGAIRINALHERLDYLLCQQPRSEEFIALLYIDLDHFKAINDSYGHAAGDAVLVEFFNRTKATLREADLICRAGGDEFIIVLSGLKDPADSTQVARKLLKAFLHRFNYQGHWLKIEMSIGVAIAPLHGSTKEELIAHADSCMYQAKKKGTGLVSLWQPNTGTNGHHPPLDSARR